MSATGKSATGSAPSTGGYQPTQAAQSQFAGGVAQQQPGTAQQLAQIGGTASPALSTLVNQQMAPQGTTGPAPTAQATMTPQSMLNQYSNSVFGEQPQSTAQQQQIQAQTDFFTQTLPPAGMSPQQMYSNYSNTVFGNQPQQQQIQASTGTTPEQQAQIKAQTDFFTQTLPPAGMTPGNALGGPGTAQTGDLQFGARLDPVQQAPQYQGPGSAQWNPTTQAWDRTDTGQQPITAQPVGQPLGQPTSSPITLPGGQSLDLNPGAPQPTPLMGGMKPADALGGGLAQQNPVTGSPYGIVTGDLPVTGPLNMIGVGGPPQMPYELATDYRGPVLSAPTGPAPKPPVPVARTPIMPAKPLAQPENLYQQLGQTVPTRTNTMNIGLMNKGAIARSGVVGNKLPQPVRQQAPAPMPTRATQGYTSRTAPKVVAPVRRTK
jgi:hypothetical protein